MKGLTLSGAKRSPGVTIWQSCSRTGLDKRNGPLPHQRCAAWKKCSSGEVHARPLGPGHARADSRRRTG